jgi:hypothetical protein
MTWIAGTGVPSRVTATCPRCRARRVFGSTGQGLDYQCGGCEWSFAFGAGTGPVNTNAAITAGTTTALPFASGGAAFSPVGNVLFISDGASSEIVVVSGTATGTSVPVSGFAFSHNSGVGVTVAVAAPQFSSVQSVLQNPF